MDGNRAKELSRSAAASFAKSTGPTGDDLAETEDVQLTEPIRNLATSLGNNPVNIFNWVQANIQYLTTYGSIQGSDLTLLTRRGNAFDIATLLIALNRAAGVPSRYVYGKIEVPAPSAMSWVGGVRDANSALSLMGQGGIPSVGVVEAGQIAKIRLEHVWVEAFVDFTPSRGSIQRAPTTWIPLDASYKNSVRSDEGLNIASNLGVLQGGLATSTHVNAAQNWLSFSGKEGVERWLESSARESVVKVLTANPNLQIANILQPVKPAPQSLPGLAGTSRYAILEVFDKWSTLPTGLRGQISIKFYDSEFARQSDSFAFRADVSLPKISNKILSATFSPESSSDRALMDNAVATGATSLPAYLIHSVPVLKLNGIEIGRGTTMPLGQDVIWSATLKLPTKDAQNAFFDSVAGDEIVFGLNMAGTTKSVLDQVMFLNQQPTAVSNLQAVSAAYWYQYDQQDELLSQQFRTISYRLPSLGVFAQRLAVTYAFGIPVSGSYMGRSMDVRISVRTEGQLPKSERTVFFQTSGTLASFLEGSTLDILFGHSIGSSRSASRLIADALAQGQRLYTIDVSNLSTALPLIDARPEVLEDITNAVNAGKVAYIHQSRLVEGTWSGSGYALLDPETGAGAFTLDGGFNGATEGTNCILQPSAQPTVSAVNAFAIGIFAALTVILIASAAPAVIAALGVMALFAFSSTAAGADITRIQLELSPGQKSVWDVLSGGRQFPAAAPAIAPQTCSDELQRQLEQEKDEACGGLAGGSCKAGEECEVSREKISRKSECIAARLEVMMQCFGGGDAGHWQQIQQKLSEIVKCQNCIAAQQASSNQCTP